PGGRPGRCGSARVRHASKRPRAYAATLPAGRHVDFRFCRGFDGKLGRWSQNHLSPPSLRLRPAAAHAPFSGSRRSKYPLSVLIWHEIANDIVGGTPVTITYCPLCNASLVFERTVENRVLDFGTTGKLRNSDLVMYDRQTGAGGNNSRATPSSAS